MSTPHPKHRNKAMVAMSCSHMSFSCAWAICIRWDVEHTIHTTCVHCRITTKQKQKSLQKVAYHRITHTCCAWILQHAAYLTYVATSQTIPTYQSNTSQIALRKFTNLFTLLFFFVSRSYLSHIYHYILVPRLNFSQHYAHSRILSFIVWAPSKR